MMIAHVVQQNGRIHLLIVSGRARAGNCKEAMAFVVTDIVV